MFSWEIQKILENSNYIVTTDIYHKITSSSQIKTIKYNPLTNSFSIQTNDGYFWSFQVK